MHCIVGHFWLSESESSQNSLRSVGASVENKSKEKNVIGNHKFKNKIILRSNMMSLSEVLMAELLSKN